MHVQLIWIAELFHNVSNAKVSACSIFVVERVCAQTIQCKTDTHTQAKMLLVFLQYITVTDAMLVHRHCTLVFSDFTIWQWSYSQNNATTPCPLSLKRLLNYHKWLWQVTDIAVITTLLFSAFDLQTYKFSSTEKVQLCSSFEESTLKITCTG